MTTLTDAREAIYQQFVTAWAATSAYTFDNEQYTPPATAPWVRLSVRHFTADQETLGGVGFRKFNRSGRLFIQVFTPLNAGARVADGLATTARGIFEGKTIGTVRFRAVSTREIGEDEGYYQINVEAPFDYDEEK